MDWSYIHKTWEKWASSNIGSSGMPLTAALSINYDPSGPSGLLSTIAEQKGIESRPIEVSKLIDFVKRGEYPKESFFIGQNQCVIIDLVTSIHESWFSARCLNTAKPAGEGAIVMQTSSFLLIGLYEGSLGSASRAMAAIDHFAWQMARRNL